MTALIVALLSVAMALPAGATLCEPAKAHCAGMPPAMKALCARIGPAMDCCHQQRQSTPARPASDEQAPLAASPDALAALPVAPVLALAVASPVAFAFSRDAALHELGLFTLHSVFRI
jgi:hypothetical protein